MSTEKIAERLDATLKTIFDENGSTDEILKALELADEAQVNASEIGNDLAIGKILENLSKVFDSMRDSRRALDTRNIQRQLKLTPSIGSGIHAFSADQLLIPAVTYFPQPTDFIFVAHNDITGASIAFEEGMTANRISPAVTSIIERGLNINIVDALLGKNQLAVSDWYEKPTFTKQVSNISAQTVSELIDLDRSGLDQERTITCYASGLFGFSDEHFDYFAQIMEKSAAAVIPKNWKLKTDFSRIGKNFGWVYGGTNHRNFIPTPFSYSR